MKARMVFFVGLCALCGRIFLSGYPPVSHAAQSDQSAVDLADRFSAPENGDSLRRHVQVQRRGRREDATVLIAPVTVRAGLSGLSGKLTLSFLAAPVFNVGDGMQMDVFLVSAGIPRPVYSRYFDAGRKAEDRDWIPVAVSLDLPKAGEVYLEIHVSGGPQGDLVADWLALAEARLARERAIQ